MDDILGFRAVIALDNLIGLNKTKKETDCLEKTVFSTPNVGF